MTAKKRANAQFLSARSVAERYGIKPNTVWHWLAQGRLPAPVKISPRCTRWDTRELDKHDAQSGVRVARRAASKAKAAT